MLTYIHSIYLHHVSLLNLALKNKLQSKGGVAAESHSSVTRRHFLEEHNRQTTNKRALFGGVDV